MLNFEYKGIALGKYVEGEIEAINNAEAAHKLKEKKVITLLIVKSLMEQKSLIEYCFQRVREIFLTFLKN